MIIHSSHVWYQGRFQSVSVRMENGLITEIGCIGKPDIDYGNLRILPGFIDIHCHGAYGFDTDSADPDGLRNWARNIVSEGVTGFLATTITEKKSVLLSAVKNAAEVIKTQVPGKDGAEILGIHFEGPFLNVRYKGAQPEEAIVRPDISEFMEYQNAAANNIRIVTLAPENDEDFRLIRYLDAHGVVASIGHTAASFEQAVNAVKAGAKSFTHTFNAMSPFSHRENGTVGAALRLHDVYSEIICDCRHSTCDAVNIFYTCKDMDHAVMVSDALMCKGYEPGTRFIFGGQPVEIYPDGTAHLTDAENHPLAGSTLKINEGLRRAVETAEVPFEKAIRSCTVNPARLLGMDDRIGLIETGHDADIAVLNDDYSVHQVYCKGIPQL